MYRILVVDDEDIIREGIKYLFDYEALGFTICGEAATGEQALTRIFEYQPDVVLMDIRMPGMSGLEVTKRARQAGFTGKIVIISSYTDFSYAQEAMRQGVQYYITKPIEEEELERVLQQFKAELDQAQLSSSTSRHYRQKARYSIIRDILQGQADRNQLNLQDLHLDTDAFQVVICEQYRPTDPEAKEQFESLLCIGNPDHSAFDQVTLHSRIIYLLKGEAIGRLQERMHAGRADPGSAMATLFIAQGRVVDSLDRIPESYRDAEQLQSRRFFCREDLHTLTHADLTLCEDLHPCISNTNLQKYAQTLLDCIQSFNRKSMERTMEQLQQLLRGCSDSVDSVKLFLAALYLQIKNQMHHLYPGDDTVFPADKNILDSFEQCIYLHQIIELLTREFDSCINAIGTSNRDSVLDEILHYIHHNYASNITLEDISQLFGYNRSYLGKIFSKKMGQNFNTYLDQVRIERSKELLLQDDSKVYSIAARVGYKNVDYFHIKFKKYTGISPAEFRKQNKHCSPVQGNTEKGPLF